MQRDKATPERIGALTEMRAAEVLDELRHALARARVKNPNDARALDAELAREQYREARELARSLEEDADERVARTNGNMKSLPWPDAPNERQAELLDGLRRGAWSGEDGEYRFSEVRPETPYVAAVRKAYAAHPEGGDVLRKALDDIPTET